MAKALLGYAPSTDPFALTRLSSENRALRQRVADLEAEVQRLHKENDGLAALATESATDEVLELA
ncbi:MAG: hypothetical protein ACTHNS_10405 [Marmoricola sp.]